MVQYVDLLEFAMEQANDGIAIMRFTDDPEVPIQIVYANETIERLSGLERAELLDPSNPFLRIQPQNRARYDELFEQVRAGKSVRFEIALGGKEHATWCEIRWSPLQYAGKKVTHYVAVVRERKPRDTEAGLLQSVLSQTSDFVVVTDATRPSENGPAVTYSNPAFAAALGLRHEQVRGKPLTGFIAPPDDPAALAPLQSRLERHLPISYELQVRNERTGNDVWIELSGHPVRDENGAPVSWIFVGKDINLRKQSYAQTAQLLTALDLADEPIVIYGVGGPLVFEPQHMNRRAAEFERPLIETALEDHRQRKRFESAWHLLEQGTNVKRLLRAGENDPRRWVTLELRPMKSARSLNTVIVIEHTVGIPFGKRPPDDITAMLALSHEISSFVDLGSRVDAFLEVLRCEWDISARFSASKRDLDLVLRAKEHNGYMVIPAGVLFDRAVAVDFFWTSTLAPRRLTALRIFLETLTGRD